MARQGQDINRESLKYLGLPLVIALVVFLGGFLVLIPKVKEIFFLRGENKRQKEKLERLEIKAQTLENLSVSNLSKRLELTFSVLPTEINPPLVLLVIEQVADHHFLKLRTFSLDKDVARGSFSCSLEGSKDNLKALFVDLDKILPLMAAGSIKVKGAGENLEVDFSLESYSLAVGGEIKLPEEISFLSEKEEKLLEDLSQFSSAGSFSPEPASSEGNGRSNPFSF